MTDVEYFRKDLIVLVSDSQQKRTVETLLNERQKSLGIRTIDFEVFSHPYHDSGVYSGAKAFLSVFEKQYKFALVMIDVSWSGSPGSRSEIEKKIQNDLDDSGWKDRSAVVALDPELEVWVWSTSRHVASILGMEINSIRQDIQFQEYWDSEHQKPHKPKELLDAILRSKFKRRSAALFVNLARKVGLAKCSEDSFLRFKKILAVWFPEVKTSKTCDNEDALESTRVELINITQ